MKITFEKMFGCDPEFPEKVYQMEPDETYEEMLESGALLVDRGDVTILDPEGKPVAFVKNENSFELMNGEWVLTYGFIGNCPIAFDFESNCYTAD